MEVKVKVTVRTTVTVTLTVEVQVFTNRHTDINWSTDDIQMVTPNW